MSTKAITIVREAARRIGDDAFSRVSELDWKDFLNQVARDLCSRMKVLEREATTGTVANEERLTYPADLVQIRYVQYTETPSDTFTYRDLEEEPFDEWRLSTSGAYLAGTPAKYTARSGWMTLVPTPSETIASAIKMGYWAIPDEVVTLETEDIPVPEFLRDHLRDGMVPLALRKDRRYEEANEAEAVWRSKEAELAKPATDRADDRRDRLRTQSRRSMLRMT